MEYFCTEKIPTWAIIYIEYGDKDTITDEEERQIKEWLDSFGFNPYFGYEDLDNPYFTHYPAFGLPCSVVDAKVYKP